MGRLQKVNAIRKPPFKNINQAKQDKNKKMIKTEIGLKFVFEVVLKNFIREQPIETTKTTNKSIPLGRRVLMSRNILNTGCYEPY